MPIQKHRQYSPRLLVDSQHNTIYTQSNFSKDFCGWEPELLFAGSDFKIAWQTKMVDMNLLSLDRTRKGEGTWQTSRERISGFQWQCQLATIRARFSSFRGNSRRCLRNASRLISLSPSIYESSFNLRCLQPSGCRFGRSVSRCRDIVELLNRCILNS